MSGSESQLLGLSGGSVRDGSSMFGNVSRISSTPYNISDDVFLQVRATTQSLCSMLIQPWQDSQSRPGSSEEEPNWDKLQNDAQFIALKISEPAVPAKTPGGLSRITSAGNLILLSLISPLTPNIPCSQVRELLPVRPNTGHFQRGRNFSCSTDARESSRLAQPRKEDKWRGGQKKEEDNRRRNQSSWEN